MANMIYSKLVYIIEDNEKIGRNTRYTFFQLLQLNYRSITVEDNKKLLSVLCKNSRETAELNKTWILSLSGL